MESYKLLISHPAKNDIKSVVDDISHNSKSRYTTRKVFDQINEALHSLDTMPEQHPFVNDNNLTVLGVHFLLVDNYVIFYRVIHENIVVIMRILRNTPKWRYLLVNKKR